MVGNWYQGVSSESQPEDVRIYKYVNVFYACTYKVTYKVKLNIGFLLGGFKFARLHYLH